jgi:acetolactate synthase-1/2/3 large subunit
VQHRLPIKIFVINNGFLGMVRQWQELFWRHRYSQVELSNPDFVKLAEAYGAKARRVSASGDVDAAVKEALSYSEGPILVEFVVEREENVYPMIPANQTVAEMLDTPLDVNDTSGRVVTLQKGTITTRRKERHVPVRQHE